MSLKPGTSVEYSSGFRKPSGALPLAILTSLRSETTAANVGLDAEVPPTELTRPPITTWKPAGRSIASLKATNSERTVSLRSDILRASREDLESG